MPSSDWSTQALYFARFVTMRVAHAWGRHSLWHCSEHITCIAHSYRDSKGLYTANTTSTPPPHPHAHDAGMPTPTDALQVAQ